ncbi:hypothetical protein [Desulfobacula sp.]|uniref:hypothetical protein n=1 Tax=Desulfobacula sp. TaxID=2593537 RepID=UPI00262214D8|nr:hypothetical protein [Desulfobacula sp.]
MLRSSIAALFIILFVSNNPTKATESEDFINNLFILELESKIANVVVEQSLKHVISKDLASAIILDKSAREILDDAIKISDTSIQDILLDSAIVEEMAANRTLDSAAKIEKIKNLVMQSGFDIFSMGVNAYGIGQNIGALWNGDGSWIENTAGLSSNVLSLALTSTSLASRIPSSAWASSWAKIGFADILTNSAAYKNVNTILLYGQIYSWLYSYMRNNEIDTIKTNLIKAQKTVQFDRKLQMDKLVNILRLKIQTTPLSTLGRGEIIDVLEDYLILTDDRFDSDLILWERFLARSNNATYLLNEFGVDNFDSLSSIERMHIALDSLSEMAVREDLRFIDNLQDSVNNGFNFSDILAGAFQGSSAYKILNVEDLKATMMPCYESASSDCSTYEYYKYFFRNEFNSALASMCIDRLAVVGQIIEALQKDIKVSQALQLLTGDMLSSALN